MQTRNDSLILLALCPLLGATQSLAAGAGLGLVVLVAVMLSGLLRLATNPLTTPALQTATAVLLWTSVITAVDLTLQSWWPQLHRDMGVFLPLLVTAPLVAAASRDASHQLPSPTLTHGAVFLGAAVLLGAARELTGQGSLFATSQWLLEPLTTARVPGLSLFEENRAFLIAIMPPGAFIAAGLLLAARNALWPPATPRPGE